MRKSVGFENLRSASICPIRSYLSFSLSLSGSLAKFKEIRRFGDLRVSVRAFMARGVFRNFRGLVKQSVLFSIEKLISTLWKFGSGDDEDPSKKVCSITEVTKMGASSLLPRTVENDAFDQQVRS